MSVSAWVERHPWSPAVVIALAFLPFKLHGVELGYLNDHAARDWERGWQMYHAVKAWWHGPELLFRGAIPGFFFNLLAGIGNVYTRQPILSAAIPSLLFCGAIGFLYDALRRIYGHVPALAAAMVMGCFPLGTAMLRYFWNPSYLFIFTAVALWCVARATVERRGNWLAGALMAMLLASQIHMTANFGALAVVLMAGVLRLVPSWKAVALVVAIHAGFLAPYYISQAHQNYPDAAARALSHKGALESRLKPNPMALPPLGVQLFHQPPFMPQTFPFSYFERFYANATRYATLGAVLFFLSLGGVVLMAGGAVMATRGFAGDADPPRRFMACCGVLMVCVILPQALWNPHVMDAVNDNFRVPVRYFVVMWPAQFALLGGGWWWLVENRRRLRPVVGGVLAVFCAGSLLLMHGFHRHAARTGEPFNYIFMSWPVHTLRDKVALARHMVDEYGVTEADLLTRVHTHDVLFIISEESIDFELRTALEANPGHPVADPSLYYFIHKPEDQDRVVVPGEIIEQATFGGLALVVYRPAADLSAWQPDPPISWYWY